MHDDTAPAESVVPADEIKPKRGRPSKVDRGERGTFCYIGEASVVEIFGLVFIRGRAVTVDDAHAVSKLASHPEFEAA